jgi:hypothetical protein
VQSNWQQNTSNERNRAYSSPHSLLQRSSGAQPQTGPRPERSIFLNSICKVRLNLKTRRGNGPRMTRIVTRRTPRMGSDSFILPFPVFTVCTNTFASALPHTRLTNMQSPSRPPFGFPRSPFDISPFELPYSHPDPSPNTHFNSDSTIFFATRRKLSGRNGKRSASERRP